MKKIIISLLVLLFSVTVAAQTSTDYIIIHHKGAADKILISSIDYITYTSNGSVQEVYLKVLPGFAMSSVSINDIDSVEFSVYHIPDVSGIVLADKLANDSTKRLYKYLKDNDGVKCLSATMANVAWDQKGADKVDSITGKFPAINGFDFIHINASGRNSWINYENTTPVTQWASAGGIVSLMWHFNVPKSEASDSNAVTCTPSETTFRCKNIFTEGSWENKWFYHQMDKTCSVLLKLQQAGIVALWRPFHEAAGNYYAKEYAGTAWFWWGYDGGDNYKKLWKTMFDYFQSKGIHNLIWVWTSQNYNGDSNKYGVDTDYYPGDDYVDIVGRDLYGYSAAQNLTEYTELKERYPGKLITLAECGNQVDYGSITSHMSTISSNWNAGAKWLYFMPWYDYNYLNGKSTVNTMADDSFWTDAMSQSYVIDRSQVSY
jgi:beta-mannanase